MSDGDRRSLPLRWRLPLSIASVLLVVVATLGWIGWRTSRLVAFESLSERLEGATTLLATALSQSGRALRDNVAEHAADSTLVAFVVNGRGEAAARGALTRIDSATPGIIGIDLWTADGRLLLATGPTSPERFPDWVHAAGGVSPFDRRGSEVTYAGAAPVRNGQDTVGWVIETRRAASNAQGIRTIQDLVGPGARFLVGTPGGLWSDLRDIESGPRAEDLEDGVTVETDVGTLGRRVGQGRRVAGTPWWVWLGFPSDLIFARARASATAVALLSVVLVVLGALAGWRLSSTITGPLSRLAAAADGITAGDYARRAPVEGDGELRQLAQSFNRMADEVEAGKHLLEERVARRTRELHDAQDALVRKERLATLGQLASGVGHELRNPLGVMTNAVFFLEATLKDPPPKVAEYLGILKSQVAISEKIVSDLLDFARIKPPLRQRVELKQVVEAQLARASVTPDVRIERHYADGDAVAVDPIQVGQVILNLATNALQAMEGQGTLTVATAVNSGTVRLSVSDTGSGVSEEHRAKIFEPLFTTKARGIGLGLAVSRTLAEANEGRLLLERTGPDGSTFVLDLPAADGWDSA